MDEFERLQAIWTAEASSDATGPAPGAVAAELLRVSRRERSIGLTKLWLAFTACAPALGWLAYRRPSALVVAGAAWCASAVLVVLALDWRGQRALSRLDYGLASTAFVGAAIEALDRYQRTALRRVRLLTGALVIGVNAIVFGALPGASGSARLLAHVAATLVPLAGYSVGAGLRRRRAEEACGALIEQLRAVRDSED